MPEPIARWNPARSVWETNESHICGHSAVLPGTFPSSGMTRGGLLYQLPTSVPLTDEPGSSSPRGLLKTPTAQLAVNGGSQHPDKRRAGGHGPTLADEVEHLLPTPTVTDMGRNKTPEEWDSWTAAMRRRHGNGNGHGASLEIEAQRLLPTPTARDWKDGPPVDAVEVNGLLGRTVWSLAPDQLLPTPTAADSKASGGSTPSDVTLTDAVVRTSLGATTNPRHSANREFLDIPLLPED